MKWSDAKTLACRLAESTDLEDSKQRFEMIQIDLLTYRLRKLDPEFKRLSE